MAQSEATVTVQNPSPPTNMSFHNYANSPPTPDASPFVDDGTAGATTAIAAPLSGAAGEASGSVAIDADPGQTSITVMGNWTGNPTADHATAKAPAVAPTTTVLAPNNLASAGGGTTVLTITGTGFKPSTYAMINGIAHPTQYNSSTSLRVSPATKRATAGTLPVTTNTNGTVTAPITWTFT